MYEGIEPERDPQRRLWFPPEPNHFARRQARQALLSDDYRADFIRHSRAGGALSHTITFTCVSGKVFSRCHETLLRAEFSDSKGRQKGGKTPGAGGAIGLPGSGGSQLWIVDDELLGDGAPRVHAQYRYGLPGSPGTGAA
jgi:hypothetical protein